MCPQWSSASDAGFLGRVEAVIDENLADEDFRVETLARKLAVSRSLLYLRLGQSGPPAKLILERRLLRAAALLSNGGGPVAEIAFVTGFRSTAHFTQRFRERFGVTPTAFRRSAP